MITLKELSEKLGLSNQQTRNLVRRITKNTPKEIIIYKKPDGKNSRLFDYDLIVEWLQKLRG